MPPTFSTVAQAIAEVGELFPDHGFVFQDLKGEETSYDFPEVERQTAGRAAALQRMGACKGDRVGLVIIEPEDFVLTFLAALRIGVVPVPMYPPMSFGNLDAYADRTARVLTNAGAKILLASARLQNVLWSLVDSVPSLERLIQVETLRDSEGAPEYPEIVPEDLAFLQYTSGSTADPKGVMVTHGSLVANSKGIILEGLQLDPTKGDKGVSWLPLYHDMGLIGFVIAPICYGVPIVFIPTLRFIKRPSVWLDTVHRHRGTASFAPNFAYALATRRVKESDLRRWDLSCLKVLGCGAEPIQPETMRAFTELYNTHCELPLNSIMPAYGMAEATLAITLKPALEQMHTLVVDAEHFSERGEVVEPTSDARAVVEFVSCGVPFEGHEVAVLDTDGNRLPDGTEGELCHRGPSLTAGYFGNPEATAAAYRDGWLRTGDLGFVKDGQVFVTGRIKDLIIVNGRNVHPQAVEWVVAEIDNVRKGNVVAFSVPGKIGEELVIVLETRDEDHQAMAASVKAAVQRELSLTAADIVCLRPGSLPKTSSGKLQRRKTREQYLRGDAGGEGSRTFGSSSDRVTLARHVAKSVWSRAKAALRG
ncbi:MAG TPA: fatty acyl-AMP ligase [Deltaproteobacteria bacterium]|nr:fatty acyl-AMP ligase [Deltaproteobacteria bacterium]